ncbi:MAG: hypothetical protein JXL84_12280 [Deltaproteobacteria bacterium]|nr:hypothetical protein [Deltaproteobacteria bacterium]
MRSRGRQSERLTGQLEEQVGRVLSAIRAEPSKKKRILSVYVSHFFGAVKETLRQQGRIMPLYVILADPVDFGVPPVTEQVARQAKEMNAEAIVWVEGFQSDRDISDVIYHVGISAPSLGVMGWIVKMKLGDRSVEFLREVPYHFDSPEKVRTLGELISQIEEA